MQPFIENGTDHRFRNYSAIKAVKQQRFAHIYHFILNYKADRELRTMNIKVEDDRMKIFQDLFFKYQKMDEKDCYIEFPGEAFKSPEFDFQLQSTSVTIFKACGFENKASFPNFKAIKEFLDIRFNMAIDKNDEDNPLIDIKQ